MAVGGGDAGSKGPQGESNLRLLGGETKPQKSLKKQTNKQNEMLFHYLGTGEEEHGGDSHPGNARGRSGQSSSAASGGSGRQSHACGQQGRSWKSLTRRYEPRGVGAIL